MKIRSIAAFAGVALFAAGLAQAQVPQYGPNITLDQAKKMIAAAEAESKAKGWPMAIAIVDTAGMLVAYARMDNTQTGSVQVSIDKAVSSAMYRRPTKAVQDGLAAGGAGMRFLNLRNMSTVEGGVPIEVGGKIIGGIGVSGMASNQDAEIAAAGLAALK